MKALRTIIPVALLIGVVFTVVHFVAHRKTDSGLIGSGSIEADEYQVSSKLPGRVSEVLVVEGDAVEQGQLLAVLEHDDIDAELARARATIQTATAAVTDLQTGSREEQIRAARARHKQALAALEGAERQLATAEEAHAKVTPLKQAADSARAGLESAEANLIAAQARVDEAERGPTKEEIETARAAVRQAEARIETARTAAANAKQVYAHAAAIEAPIIAASTEHSVHQAGARLAQSDLARVKDLRDADAATPQALDRAEAQDATANARVTGAQKSMRDAEQQVALSRAQAKQAADAAQKQLVEAERAADAARAQLDVMLAGTREERVRQARAAEAAAQSQVRAACDTLAAAEASHRDRLDARSGLQAAQTAVNTARATAEAAKADLDLLIAGNRETVIQQAEGRLAEAQAALEAAQVKRAYCDIKAPCTGTVTEVVALGGEMLAAGAPVVVVTDLQNLFLRAYVGFEQLGAIKQGQNMQVSTQAVPGRTFTGEVTRISDKAEFTPKDVQTPDQRIDQVYWIKIALGDGEGLLKSGMPADVVATD